MTTETAPEALEASANGVHDADPAETSEVTATVLPEPDEKETVPRFGDPRDAVVSIVRDRLERMLQPVDDPSPVAWLRDPEYDRLRWAIATAHNRPGGSTTEDEAEADKILDALTTFERAGDRPVWNGVNVITAKDLGLATAEDLPPASIFAASVRTPAYIYVDAVCPVCNIAGSITLQVEAKLTAVQGSRKLQLAAKATALPHVCYQQRLELGGPSRPARGQTALDLGDEDEDEGVEVPPDGTEAEISQDGGEGLSDVVQGDDDLEETDRDAIHAISGAKPARDEPDDLSDLPF